MPVLPDHLQITLRSGGTASAALRSLAALLPAPAATTQPCDGGCGAEIADGDNVPAPAGCDVGLLCETCCHEHVVGCGPCVAVVRDAEDAR